jgi:hypothetical protein
VGETVLARCFNSVLQVLVVGSTNSVDMWIWQIVSLLSAIICMKNAFWKSFRNLCFIFVQYWILWWYWMMNTWNPLVLHFVTLLLSTVLYHINLDLSVLTSRQPSRLSSFEVQVVKAACTAYHKKAFHRINRCHLVVAKVIGDFWSGMRWARLLIAWSYQHATVVFGTAHR